MPSLSFPDLPCQNMSVRNLQADNQFFFAGFAFRRRSVGQVEKPVIVRHDQRLGYRAEQF